jgi:L-cysteine:1D-myo-inositol 2-amino-2-deoxy-alpha-D-glucopyranoside ligase
VDTLAHWRRALSLGAGAPAAPVVTDVLAAMADDLDAPRAVATVQGWVDATLGNTGHLADTTDADAALRIHALLDAALGLAL